jgi:hypothetical protein
MSALSPEIDIAPQPAVAQRGEAPWPWKPASPYRAGWSPRATPIR